MRICVFGAGAVGGHLAARLARAGKNVSLVARGPHLQAIRADGLRFETPAESFTVHPQASDDPASLGPQDVIIVSAKTPALPGIARSLAPMLHEGTRIVFAVNGVFWFYAHGFAPGGIVPDTSRLDPDGTLHQLLGPERALGMVIYSPNAVPEPGLVRCGRATGDRFVLGGAVQGDAGPAAEVQAALADAGLTIEVTADIRQAMWRKLSLNVASSPLCTLTAQTSQAAFADQDVRRLGTGLVGELLAIAGAHGFELGIEPARQTSAESRMDHKPSMLQDLERGRPMEIDSQLRVLQDFSRQLGIATPTLDLVLPLLILRARAAGAYPAAAG